MGDEIVPEVKKIERGQPLTEMTKGSLEYTYHLIRTAFFRQFARDDSGDWFWIEEAFADHVIVNHEKLPPDEFYYVTYTREGENYIFAPRDQWVIVELAYQPKAMAESRKTRNKLSERVTASIELIEADAAAGSGNPDGPWRIRGKGITANVVNGNGRRYKGHVLEAAVKELQKHLRESAGQGRLVLTGEVDHPQDKGNRTPLLQETIINWDTVSFNGKQVLIEGWLLGTSKGKDVRAQMLGGVKPDISQRGYGQSLFVDEAGGPVEEVLDLTITGYDLVSNGSDPEAGVTMFESKQSKPGKEENNTMDELTLASLREKYPQLVAQIEAERDKTRRAELEAQLEARRAEDERVAKAVTEREAALRKQLGIGEADDLTEALRKRDEQRQKDEADRKREQEELQALREAEQKRQVTAHIAEKVKDLKYPAELKATLQEAMLAVGPATVEAADTLLETKKKEYDAIMARMELSKRGFGGVQVVGPVLETELGIPAFARPAYEIVERLVERNLGRRRDFRKAITPNEIFTRRYLESFDKRFQTQLIEEARQMEQFLEVEATTDLNLPYSVSRAIIEEAVPELVALSIFDFGLEDNSPTRIYFEAYSAVTGAAPTITDESFTSDHDTWVALANKRIRPGTVTVTSSPAGTTYAEYDDYLVDYANGRIYVLSTGSMADSTAFLIDYTYDKVRAGENTAIQRGKGSLSYQTIEMIADRLAGLVTDEAITFARTQLGWDAVTRTLNMIIREITEMIDTGAIRLALASAIAAGNNGGTWNSATANNEPDLVKKLGAAAVAVENDNYLAQFFLLSLTNADRLANWDGFTRDGFPDAVLNSTGYVGQVKGRPVFKSKHMPDTHGLTGHRELVQHRVLSSKPMMLKGPFQAYSSGNLVAAQEWYAEEYNATVSLIKEKGGYITIT